MFGLHNPTEVKYGSELVYRLARGTFDGFFATSGGIRAVGVENVPKQGGVILAPNHLSHLDPPALACTCRHRRVLAMGKGDLWNHKAFGLIIGGIGAYPVQRDNETEAVRWAVSVLEGGHTLLVFPEGTRGDGQTLFPIERGTGMLARRTGALVVPVGIVGTEKIWPKGQSKPSMGHRITVAYGKPFTYESVSTGANEKENRVIFARELEKRILDLCQEHGLPLRASEG
ncbi:1-acyl-sn-glycerol-3-phosphate acyltransferase [bacterium]|nr:MAG: 1-acyl-sn-glycerol-3-phosphate acyltransferase [bacterium]